MNNAALTLDTCSDKFHSDDLGGNRT